MKKIILHERKKRENKRKNGWLMLEMLLVIVNVALLIGILFPGMSQTVLQNRHCELYEEVLRQGSVVDTTIFQALRYGRQFTFASDGSSVRFYTFDGKRSGFKVENKQFYLLLSNNQKQPLTGGSSAFCGHTIQVQPYAGRPYFSKNGRFIEVALLLQDEYGHVSWPFLLTVVPVNEEE